MKITIYQPNNPTFRVDKSVERYFKEDYKVVFEEELDDSLYTNQTNYDILEGLFERFNCGDYPEEYKGHSLSVGDIVEIATTPDEHGCFSLYGYICDSFDWKNIMLYDRREDIEKVL